MALGYIDASGITIPTFAEIQDYLTNEFRNIYGQDVYLAPDSKDGQWIAIQSQAILDTYLLAADVYNNFSPVTAQGTGLDINVALNGIARKADTYSTVDLDIVGTPKTIIRNGTVSDNFGQTWLLDQTVEIPDSGQIRVTATSAIAGDIQAPAGSITIIGTATRGWTSVNNPIAAIAGDAVETDYRLRQRQAISVSLPARTIVSGIIANILNLQGVKACAGYENDTNIIDTNGIPPHSICMVVLGGEVQSIADTIFKTKAPGCGTYGEVTEYVEDRYGVVNIVSFKRPTTINVFLRIFITPKRGYVNSTGDAIVQQVVDYINGLGIGSTMFISRLFSVINACEPQQNVVTFDIDSITTSIDGSTYTANNIVAPFDGLLYTQLNYIYLGVNP